MTCIGQQTRNRRVYDSLLEDEEKKHMAFIFVSVDNRFLSVREIKLLSDK